MPSAINTEAAHTAIATLALVLVHVMDTSVRWRVDISELTQKLSGGGPVSNTCKQEPPPAVRWSDLVGSEFHDEGAGSYGFTSEFKYTSNCVYPSALRALATLGSSGDKPRAFFHSSGMPSLAVSTGGSPEA